MQRFGRREFLKAAAAGGAGLACGILAGRAHGADAKDRPNIVFILSDDYGIDGVGCYGSDRFKGRTPNLDALAAGGIRFERCHSAPLCGPTRCQIMTGRYGFRTGGLTNGVAGQPQPQDEYPLARILKEAGYATCSAGKWRQVGGTPADWGFDEYVTDPTAGGWYWQKSYTKNGTLVESAQDVYCPDVAHEFAMDFIRRHKDGPFFVYYPTHLVHNPILRTPDTKEGATPDKEALYDANVAYLDKLVGKVVAELDGLGLREKTLILFSGDNGTAGRSFTIGGRAINGHKGTMQEGGVRVPLIANWKGTTPAGGVLGDLVDFSDLLPTFVEVAGAKLPDKVPYDGRSFAAQLHGEKGTPREWVFVQLGRKWYVKDAGWKLNESGELFDLKDAPFVEKPVAAGEGGDEAAAARKRLQAVLERLNPAGGKTISAADQDAEKARAQARRKKQAAQDGAAKPAGGKPRRKKASAGPS